MAQWIRLIGWLIAGVYATIPLFWLAIHPFADYWRRRHRSAMRVLAPLWLLMWVLAWLATAPLRDRLLYETPWSWVLAAPLWVVSVYVYFGGRIHMRHQQVIGQAQLAPQRHEQRLVTTGLHARLRHPLYLAHLCTLLGWAVGTGSLAIWVLTGFGVAAGLFMIRVEERELEDRFGEEYREYKRRVPAILPRL